MNVTVEKTSGCHYKLTVEVGADVVSRVHEKVVRSFAQKMPIPGSYTKLQAKIARVKMLYKKQIEEDTTYQIVEDTSSEAWRSQSLVPVSVPQIIDAPKLQAGQPYRYVLSVEVEPVVENVDYKGLLWPVIETEVTDDHVDKALDRLAQSHGEMQVSDEPVAEETYVRIDMVPEGLEAAVTEVLSRKDRFMKVNDDMAEVLRTALIGKSSGDSLVLQASPEEMLGHAAPEGEGHPGKADKLTWKVTIGETKKYVKPVLDDAFAKKVRDVESLDILKGMLRKESEEQLAREKTSTEIAMIHTQLTLRNPVDLPTRLLREIVSERLEQIDSRYASILKGPYADQMRSYIDQEKQSVVQETIQGMMSLYIRNAVNKAEGFEVTDELVEAKIRAMAEEQGKEVSFVRAGMDDQAWVELKDRIASDSFLGTIEKYSEKKPAKEVAEVIKAMADEMKEKREKQAAETQAGDADEASAEAAQPSGEAPASGTEPADAGAGGEVGGAVDSKEGSEG